MNKIEKITTEDGSHSFYVPEIDEHYHSHKGAVQESEHIFIGQGLLKQSKKEISILEIGFGTGLNAFLTFLTAQEKNKQIKYTGIEKYPLDYLDVKNFNYPQNDFEKDIFERIHTCKWNEKVRISDFFELRKIESDLTSTKLEGSFDVTYFDAFSPEKQPELWTEEVFEKIFRHTNIGGILTTYSVKGVVKRALRNVGFDIKKYPGPPGKREILVATKKEK